MTPAFSSFSVSAFGAATVAVEAAIRSDEAAATTVALHTVIYDEAGKVVSAPPSTPPPPPTPLPAGGAVTLQASAELPNGAELWSIMRPYLYTVALAIVDHARRALAHGNSELALPSNGCPTENYVSLSTITYSTSSIMHGSGMGISCTEQKSDSVSVARYRYRNRYRYRTGAGTGPGTGTGRCGYWCDEQFVRSCLCGV